MFKTPSMPPPPAPPPPPPTPAHMAYTKATGNAYSQMQRGGLAGTILTSAAGASDYATGGGKGKSLLGQ